MKYRCQTYEGGIGGYPGNEAHGGYTFCGVAAMVLMGKINMLNVPLLLVCSYELLPSFLFLTLSFYVV